MNSYRRRQCIQHFIDVVSLTLHTLPPFPDVLSDSEENTCCRHFCVCQLYRLILLSVCSVSQGFSKALYSKRIRYCKYRSNCTCLPGQHLYSSFPEPKVSISLHNIGPRNNFGTAVADKSISELPHRSGHAC